MSEKTSIAVAYGDGIGPEIMEATLLILQKAEARINVETIEIGEKLYTKGWNTGISDSAWETVKRNKILLKAPITTPQGKGYKSLNVTFRKALGLYANVRPAVSYYPFVDSNHEKMDLVVVRENEEDLYSGVEYRPSADSAVALKFITRQGSERIARYAFEYAKINNRKRVTAFVKDNIMKISDGLFHNVFKEVAAEYPEIQSDSMIVDIGSARVASRPQDFDVIVTLNLYGDIVSDIAADVSGSVGLAGSCNVGDEYAMFEAIHGSAPDIAGQQIANPSGLLNGALLMLEYIGQADVAVKIQNAWLKTIEDGIHTADIYKEGKSKKKVSTMEFAKTVVENLGKNPSMLETVAPKKAEKVTVKKPSGSDDEQTLIGFDVYIDPKGVNFDDIINKLSDACEPILKFHVISQKGLKVWPDAGGVNVSDDLLQCRFIGYEDAGLTQKDVFDAISKIAQLDLKIAYTYNLFTYGEDSLGFTKAQGE